MLIKVLLVKNVAGLGNSGDIVTVQSHRFDSFLKVDELAVEASSQNLALWKLKEQISDQPHHVRTPKPADTRLVFAVPVGASGVPDYSGLNEDTIIDRIKDVSGHLIKGVVRVEMSARVVGPCEVRVVALDGTTSAIPMRIVPYPRSTPAFLLEDLLTYSVHDHGAASDRAVDSAYALTRELLRSKHLTTRADLGLRACSLLLNCGYGMATQFVEYLAMYCAAKGGAEFYRHNMASARSYYLEYLRLAKGLSQILDFEIVKHCMRSYLVELGIIHDYVGENTQQIGSILADLTTSAPVASLSFVTALFAIDPELVSNVLSFLPNDRNDTVRELLITTLGSRFKDNQDDAMPLVKTILGLDESAHPTIKLLSSLLDQLNTALRDYFVAPDVTAKAANYAQATRLIEEAALETYRAINTLPRHYRIQRLHKLLNALRELIKGDHLNVFTGVLLDVRFTSNRAPFGQETEVEVEVENRELGVARDVLLVLEQSEHYHLNSKELAFGHVSGHQVSARRVSLIPSHTGSAELRGTLHYVDASSKRYSRAVRHVVNFTDPAAFRPIPNPYYTGEPVDDPEMFFGREDIIQAIALNLLGEGRNAITVIHGQRRTGKTSILVQIKEGKRHDTRGFVERYIPVFHDLEYCRSFTDARLLHMLAEEMSDQISIRGYAVPEVPPLSKFTDTPTIVFDRFLSRLEQAIPSQLKVLLILDEFDTLIHSAREKKGTSEGISWDFFGYLRKVLQFKGAKFSFIIVGQDELVNMMKDYTQRLYEIAGTPIEVSVLDEESAKALIQTPYQQEKWRYDSLEWYSGAVSRILRLTACHPYFISRMCHQIILNLNFGKRTQVTVSDVSDAAHRLIHEGDIFREFINRMSKLELFVLCTLASVVDDVNDWADTRQIAARVHDLRAISIDQVMRTLEGLAGKYFLEAETVVDARRYRIRMGMLRDYLNAKMGLRELALLVPTGDVR